MTFRRRVVTIYRKELVDILRDHRTLVAMIVVPIVLYPLLMLGSIQAVSYQADALQDEELVLGVISERDKRRIERIVREDEALLTAEGRRAPETTDGSPSPPPAPPTTPPEDDAIEADEPTVPTGPDDADRAPAEDDAQEGVRPQEPLRIRRIVVLKDAVELEQAILARAVQAGIVFESTVAPERTSSQTKLRLYADREELHSAHALARLTEMLQRRKEAIVAWRLHRAELPPAFIEPVRWTMVNLSAPSSILAQILPLILVLMTITGAIYPAIDLTAGERERGTLETLMVCPVPVLDLIVGKFLVVTTVAIMGATLNLASVSATVYFGGFKEIVATEGGGVPAVRMVFILVCLIPFAVLMSAIMIAVCSFARTFKEAQNYVTPVILAVLIPGGAAALPATRLEGVMLVIPVANMVLFAREVLLGADIPWGAVVSVLLSTTLYAACAVAVAASVFGRESVVFADAVSLRTVLSRRLIKPTDRPTVTMGLIVIALLFPAWFFFQASMQPVVSLGTRADYGRLLRVTALVMPILFVLLPAALLMYRKVRLTTGLSLPMPRPRFVLAGALLGVSAWVPARELAVLQELVIPPPSALSEGSRDLAETLVAMPLARALLFIAVIPGLCEELLFRGFLLTSLRRSARKWTAILASAAIFGTFHFVLYRMPVTIALGVALALLAWHSGSIWPGVITHVLHNGVAVLAAVHSEWVERLGIVDSVENGHLPVNVVIAGCAVFALGILLAVRPGRAGGSAEAVAS
jgi:ABC-2 type transport system permease protein/sodium transport system permease protein